MNSLVNNILNIGIRETNSVKENKKVKLLNIFGFSWAVMIIVITIFDIIFGRELIPSLKLHGVSYILLVIIFLLQSKKKYTLARLFFLGAILGVTFVFSNYGSPSNLVENFYFIYPLVAIILIDKKWVNISVLIVCFLFYCLPNFYFSHYPKDTILPVLVFSVMIGAFVILNYSESLNKKHEKELLRSNQKLSETYLELEERKNSELASMQLKALKAQMNPHFMFNAINSIQYLILKENKQDAYNALTLFSSFLRDNLKTSEDSMVRFHDELSSIKKYLDLESLRFHENFSYTIHGDKEVDNVKIPTMLIQPFVENAIRYGLLHKTEGHKNITISFYQKEIIECIVEDNGIGIKAAKEIKPIIAKDDDEYTSTQTVENRLQLLKKAYKTDIGIFYDDEVLEGTKVIIKIPYTI